MTASFLLTPEQRDEFERRGILRLAGLFSADRIDRARAHVRDRLALLGLWRDGAWQLDAHPRPQWPDTGPQASKAIGNKHPAVDALLDEPALLNVVDQLLDGHAFDRELYKRPQVLFSLPNIDVWTMPTGWHVDGPRLASGRRPGVQLFTFLDPVAPRGGGTLAIAGSHRLFNDGRVIRLKALRRLLCRHEYFRALYGETRGDAKDRALLPGHAGVLGDVTLEAVELTGAPGDAYIMDLRVLHAVAPNAAARPRLMATHRFWRADVMQELAQAHGWT